MWRRKWWLHKAPRITKAQFKLYKCLRERGVNCKLEEPVKAPNGRTYWMDIYIPELKLDIEVDGATHLRPSRVRKDKIRDEQLTSIGITTIRLEDKLVNKMAPQIAESIRSYDFVGCGTCRNFKNGKCSLLNMEVGEYDICHQWVLRI